MRRTMVEFPAVTEEMRAFAGPFGGIEQIPLDPVSEGAYRRLANLSERYTAPNSLGEHFRYCFSPFASFSRNAVCGWRNGQYLLGHDAGLKVLASEISLLVVTARFDSDGIANVAQKLQLLGNSAWHGISHPAQYDMNRLRDLNAAAIGRPSEADRVFETANSILFFVLRHELSHAVDGPVRIFRRFSEPTYLGEMQDQIGDVSLIAMRLAAEVSADWNAITEMTLSLGEGPVFYGDSEVSSREDRYVLFFAGVFLLLSSWFAEACHAAGIDVFALAREEDRRLDLRSLFGPTHPMLLDRLTFLLSNFSAGAGEVARRVGPELRGYVDDAISLLGHLWPSVPESVAIQRYLRNPAAWLERGDREIGEFLEQGYPQMVAATEKYRFYPQGGEMIHEHGIAALPGTSIPSS